MRFRSLRHWDNVENLHGLVLFTQIIDEMLFDFALDTYKPSAMNSIDLCYELLSVYKDVNEGVVNEAHIKYVADELVIALRNDEVAVEIIDLDVKECCNVINGQKVINKEKISTLEMLCSRANPQVYKSTSERMILDAVEKCDLNRIRSLTRKYITFLINFGYSSSYIYALNSRTFFHSRKVDSIDFLRKFFDSFSMESNTYKVIIGINGKVDHIKESVNSFNMRICLPSESEVHVDSLKKLGSNDYIAIMTKIEGLDEFSARIRAEERVELVFAMATLFHHGGVIRKSEPALVCLLSENGEEHDFHVLGKPINPMLKCIDARPQKAAKQFNKFMKSFYLQSNKQFMKFFRASQLHANALSSDTTDSRFVSVWTALESLVPTNEEDKKPLINQITDSLMPFLMVDYSPRLVKRMVADLYNWDRNVTREFLNRWSGGNLSEKLVSFLSGDDYDDAFKELSEYIGNFYLLKERIEYFRRCFESPDAFVAFMDKHKARVSWQIKRIYRARNKIMHEGKVAKSLESLTENLHDYLDVTMSYIVRLACDGRKTNSIEQAFQAMKIAYSSSENCLKDLGSTWEGNAVKLILPKVAPVL